MRLFPAGWYVRLELLVLVVVLQLCGSLTASAQTGTDAGHLLTACRHSTIRVLIVRWQVPQPAPAPQASVTCRRLRAPSSMLATASGSLAYLWNAQAGELSGSFTAHTAQIDTVSFSPDGGQVLSGARDGTARIWDAATGDFRSAAHFGGRITTIWPSIFCPSSSAMRMIW